MPALLTRARVKQNIQDGDRVFVAPAKTYTPETVDHQQCWPKIVSAIEQSNACGAKYSTLKALCGSNKDYVAYLIGQLQVLRCPAVEDRLDAKWIK